MARSGYLIGTRLGIAAEVAALRELTEGVWDIATIDLTQTLPISEHYADHAISAADASNVILADRYQTTTIATLDRRDFSVLRPLSRGYFAILP